MDKATGSRLWSSAGPGGALVASEAAASASAGALTYIAEPMGDGPLYVHAPGKAITRLPVTIKELVAASPFRTADGTVYLGHKQTRFLALDARSGAVLHDYGTGNGDEHTASCPVPPGGTAGARGDPLPAVPIFLGRTEFHVSMYEPGARLGSPAKWNVSYAEYGSARMDWLLGDAPTADAGAARSPYSYSVALGHNGDLVVSSPAGELLWAHRFAHPPLAVFDLAPDHEPPLRGSPSASAAGGVTGFHVMRRSPLTFPSSILAGDSAPATAFIGHLHGTLFALSSRTHFPTLLGDDGAVTFPLPLTRRPATDKEGALLIDAPAGSDSTTTTPADSEPVQRDDALLDESPEMPYLYTCRVGAHAFPQCLVGVHPILGSERAGDEEDDELLLLDETEPASPSPTAPAAEAARPSDAVAVSPPPLLAKAPPPPAPPIVPDLALVSADGTLSTADPDDTLGPAVGAIVVISDPTGASSSQSADPASTASRNGNVVNKRLKMPFDIDVEVEVSPQTGFGFGVAVTLLTGGLTLFIYRKVQNYTQSRRSKQRKRAAAADDDAAAAQATPAPPSLSQTLAMFAQQLVIHYLTRMTGQGGFYGMRSPTSPTAAAAAPSPSMDPPTSSSWWSGSSSSIPGGFKRPSTPSGSATPVTPAATQPSTPAAGGPTPARSGGGTPPLDPTAPIVQPVVLADGSTRLGRLLLSDQVLGYGSHGTVVYRGSYDGRDVAVKRLLRDFFDVATHEVSLLVESDDHYNVVRYYCKEQCDRFLYIALELCDCSLADVVEGLGSAEAHEEVRRAWNPARILYQVLSGLHHLHALKIVHRDLKPHNILLVRNRRQTWNPAGARVLISDFGLCKKLEVDQSSFGNTATHNGGTFGWRAPELLTHPTAPTTFSSHSSIDKSNASASGTPPHSPSTATLPRRRLTRALDIFSLGCLFYYVLTEGDHPFGDRYTREINILRDQGTLAGLDPAVVRDAPLARDMIGAMIAHDPAVRPTTGQLLVHPYFWTPARRLNFLADVSDRFETETKDPPSALVQVLERGAENVVEGDWTQRIDRSLAGNLGKYRKYRGESVVDLLRALRNKKHHYGDLPPGVRRALGPLPDGFLAYFTSRFPNLFLHVYGVVRDTPELRADSLFAGYFAPSADPAGGDRPGNGGFFG
ncbi:bifunctional endoribonuclease/protein kinase ire1 [Blastocladiella emersonii ATCC 22665]|nr:bifunctional endoribonuclease/protein kinase ire1 [Blastocladiella emersonii ATCC 22665]